MTYVKCKCPNCGEIVEVPFFQQDNGYRQCPICGRYLEDLGEKPYEK